MEYNKAIDFYISHLLEPHEVEINKEHPDSIYWVKDGVIIAQIQNPKSFWVHQDIWVGISRMFDLDYFKIRSAMKEWLEQHYGRGELTPKFLSLGKVSEWEQRDIF